MAMRPGRVRTWVACAVAAVVGLGAANVRAESVDAAEPVATREAIAFFETSVRPLLAANCYECHGPDKQKGGLRLDSRPAILRGGEIGPALVPGKPAESAIVRAIAYTDPD